MTRLFQCACAAALLTGCTEPCTDGQSSLRLSLDVPGSEGVWAFQANEIHCSVEMFVSEPVCTPEEAALIGLAGASVSGMALFSAPEVVRFQAWLSGEPVHTETIAPDYETHHSEEGDCTVFVGEYDVSIDW